MNKLLILSSVALLTMASSAFATETVTLPAAKPVSPEKSVHLETGVKKMIPFRVWVSPKPSAAGAQVSGHYEYFEMYMDTGDAQLVVDQPGTAPAVHAVVTEVMGEPALK